MSATPARSRRLVGERVATEPRGRSSSTSRCATRTSSRRSTTLDGAVLIAVAARVGETRLIDNVAVDDRVNIERRGRPRRSRQRKRVAVRRTMMKSKIHRATVTGADLDYVGSITLDPELMELADIREFEQVHVLDIDNGARFETYAMDGRPGRRDPQRRRGPARRTPATGSSSSPTPSTTRPSSATYEPQIVHVDERNRPIPRRARRVQRAGSQPRVDAHGEASRLADARAYRSPGRLRAVG